MTGKVTSDEEDGLGKSVRLCVFGGGITSSMLGCSSSRSGGARAERVPDFGLRQPCFLDRLGGFGRFRRCRQFREIGQAGPGKSGSRRTYQVIVAEFGTRKRQADCRLIEPALQLQAIGLEDIPTGHSIRSCGLGSSTNPGVNYPRELS